MQQHRPRRCRLAIVAASLACTFNATAQTPAQTPKTLDSVTVTGTRIKSKTMTATSPVMEIDAEAFKETGATRVEDLVNQYPQLSSEFDGFTNNGANTYATVSLRDLGPQRTLSLINGRRLPIGIGDTSDLTIVPPALLKRVDVLTGGASAVYGSDAVAGVVNFVLNDEFEGIRANVGYSGYQHRNDNAYMRQLHDKSGYAYPQGNSGLDGIARNLDLAIGGAFGERGHAMGWLTWRKNEALSQDRRDYSSCALNAAGNACGGSATSDPPTFFYIDGAAGNGYAHLAPDGHWLRGAARPYNYAPSNFYQRPDERFTAGFALKYEIVPQFQPYIEGMFVNHKSTVQIAPSGTFFADDLKMSCQDPLVGSLCKDLGLRGPALTMNVGKRNVEGGPRVQNYETQAFRLVTGARGDLNERWSYDAYFLYARNSTGENTRNDFLKDPLLDALRGCPPGSFRGCLPYNVWVPGGVTPAAAAALTGTGVRDWSTTLKVLSGYVSGDTGWALPTAAGETFKIVGGMEWRSQMYSVVSDTQTRLGRYAGSGGPRPDVRGSYNVTEVFLEGALPLVVGAGALDRLGTDLGYRYSDYSTSGGVSTYKVGLSADLFDNRLHLRGGWNRAIRGPGVVELFRPMTTSLWSGSDPCAGARPEFTQAQCQRTGALAAQYGSIPTSSASQYNQLAGGNTALKPETADTWSIGAAFSPLNNLDLSLDYAQIRIRDTISSIGASNILRNCGLTGLASLCSEVKRHPMSGDLWRGDSAVGSGYVRNVTGNFGNAYYRGLDFSARYRLPVGPGSLMADFVGTYLLQQEIEPIPGVPSATYDCVGIINASCNSPRWRHVANLRYTWDDYSLGVRWRYRGKVAYRENDGSAGKADHILAGNGGIAAANYFDLNGSVRFGDNWEWTAGVNNVFDRAPPLVGQALAGNGNSPGGYDPAGRYLFTSLSYRY
ncbi:MAG TPA: TonB-dependent receptor [Stenotrophomonas sp.]|nr:TonB-dependent receptor [Stenotrophomonas sp.]